MAKAKRKVQKPSQSSKKKNTKKGSSSIWGLIVFFGVIIGIGTWYLIKTPKSKISKNEFIQEIPKGFSSFGIDISHHQGKINWKTLFDKEKFDSIIGFVYCKATEGHTHVDTQWETNRKTLNNRGIPNGAYHFFTTNEEPLAQAKHFLNYWKKREVDLPPVLDVETEGNSDQELIKNMHLWLKEVEMKTGMRPVIYTSYHFFETKFLNDFKDYNFWIAAYSRKPDKIDDPRILHWQYSEEGTLPGIDEAVDFNVSKIAF